MKFSRNPTRRFHRFSPSIPSTGHPALEQLENRQLLSASIGTALPNIVGQPGQSDTLNLDNYFTSNVVKFSSNVGTYEVALTQNLTPKTVANFLAYVNSGAYNNSIVHRVVPGFIIQGGGFNTAGDDIPTNPPVVNEYKSGVTLEPTTGTISMAKLGNNPNSATNQWFINLADNSSILDSQNGGFTSFGTVLGTGMTTVNTIAGLPLVDGSSLNPSNQDAVAAFEPSNGQDSFPVISPTAGVNSSNLVVDQTVAVDNSFEYTAQSSNPGLVALDLEGAQLGLDYAAGQTGTSTISITGTGPDGTTASTSFTVTVGNVVNIGTSTARYLTFVNANGTKDKITVTGGTAAVDLTSPDFSQNVVKGQVIVTSTGAGIDSINITNTTSAPAQLSITGPAISVGAVNDSAALKSITAPTTTLTSALNLGSIGQVTLAGVNGATLNLGASVLPAGASLQLGTDVNTSISSAGAIHSIISKGWTSTSPSTVTAPSIGQINSTGDFSAAVTTTNASAVPMNANIHGAASGTAWTIAGPVGQLAVGSAASTWGGTFSSIKSLTVHAGGFAPALTAATIGQMSIVGGLTANISAATITSLHVTGNLSNDTITLSGANTRGQAIASLVATGSISGATIAAAAGSIQSVVAGAIASSSITAGTEPDTFPSSVTGFTADLEIGSVRVAGASATFSNSTISAETIGALTLGSITTNNGGTIFGVAAHRMTSFSAVFGSTPVHLGLQQLSDEATISTVLSVDGVNNLGDFTIRIV